MAEHVPDRPSWNCHSCGRPWPCPPARTDLARQHETAPTAVGAYLHGQYLVAAFDIRDRPDRNAHDLYERIVGWLPR